VYGPVDRVVGEGTKASKEALMSSVARVTEISAISETSFEDAVKTGISRASQTLRGLRSAWIKEQEVEVGADGQITGYKVNMLVTFVLE